MDLQKNCDWARAIAIRITDEHPIKTDFPEDSDMLRYVLEKLFSENEWAVKKLIGTGLIEEDYFEPLD